MRACMHVSMYVHGCVSDTQNMYTYRNIDMHIRLHLKIHVHIRMHRRMHMHRYMSM